MTAKLKDLVFVDIHRIQIDWKHCFEPLIEKGQISRERYDKVYNAMSSILQATIQTTTPLEYINEENLKALKSLGQDLFFKNWEKEPTDLPEEIIHVYDYMKNVVDKTIARMQYAFLLQRLKKLLVPG